MTFATERVLLSAALLILIAIATYVSQFIRLSISRKDRSLFFVFLTGCLLRLSYLIATPYQVRGYDTDAHISYIQYVASNFALPLPSIGWEYHQAPFYYIVSGFWYALASAFGFNKAMIIGGIQLFSFVCSAATLFIALEIGSLLFPKKDDRIKRLLFGSLVATWPTLVFMSARIGNEVLYQPLTAATLLFLLRWWGMHHMKDWYACCVCFVFAFLAKVSAAVFLPMIFFAAMFRTGSSFKRRLMHGAITVALLLAMTAWLPAYRLVTDVNAAKILSFGNHGMSPKLKTHNTVQDLLTFNPVKILEIPYNDPWKDASRRTYYPEYLYRSAFFGEFHFAEMPIIISRLMLFFGFFALAFACVGFVRDIVRSPIAHLPLWLFMLGIIASGIAYRLMFPYTPNQDFRLIELVILPLAYYAAAGTEAFGILKKPAWAILWMLAGLCSVFTIILYVQG